MRVNRLTRILIVSGLLIPMVSILSVTGIDLFPGGGGGPPPDTEDPIVGILSPTPSEKIRSSFPIQAYASDNIGVIKVHFYIDGVWKGSDSSSPYRYYWNIFDGYSNGAHTIKVKAIDSAGNTASEILTCYLDFPRVHALIVGISDYEGEGSDLDYADDDADDWHNFIDSTFDNSNIVRLKDSSATESAVASKFDYFANVVDSNDIFIFTFSGHGEEDALLMHDNDAQGNRNKLSESELETKIEAIDTDKTFIFLDACYSGGVGDYLDDHIGNMDDVLISCSSNWNEVSQESSIYENGWWTYCFLEYSWIDKWDSDPYEALEDIHDFAIITYNGQAAKGGVYAQLFDGNTNEDFEIGETC